MLPSLVRSNVAASEPRDRFMRAFEYLRDPQGWVRETFRAGEPFPVCGVMYPGGADRELVVHEGDVFAPIALFRDAEARDAFIEETAIRKARGLATLLYLPRVHADGTSVDIRNPATRRLLREDLAPYREAGLTHLGFDNSSGPVLRLALDRLHEAGDAFGLNIFGEAIPAWPRPDWPVPMNTRWARKAAWACTSDYIEKADPNRVWRAPAGSNLTVWIFDERFPNVDDAVKFVQNRRAAGFGVGVCGVPTRSEVLAAILAP